MTASKFFKTRADLDAHRQDLLQTRGLNERYVAICTSGCTAYGSNKIGAAIQEALKNKGMDQKIRVKLTGCQGFCEKGPLLVIHPERTFYQQVKLDDVDEIVEKTLLKGEIIERLLFIDENGKTYKTEDEVPFYSKQQRLLLSYNSKIDPYDIDDYILHGGYSALEKVLEENNPEGTCAKIRLSGLRGRGGGGFPAGVKWETCRSASSSDGVRYIICNADEGDPGAFMDRALIEGNPHSILEGMIIGAFAVGIPGKPMGYIYIRNEYPIAVERVKIAINQAQERGLLGKNIFNSGMDFDIQVNRGGGAFVCGESTALMASIEGRVGEPRAKHIHTVKAGLYDKPSDLNNVETWANVPLIINGGIDWYTSIGTGDVSQDPWGGSKGTKIFALVGKVNNTGLVEVPMGTTLREIIFNIGGGIRGGKKFKAVQTGGPSGGCLPESLLDLEIDFDKLTKEGSMMGSGGMIVMDERTCMVDVAKYFLGFLKFESCGKCTTCREGLKRLYELVTDVTKGRATEETLTLIEELADTVEAASLCALGTSAVNPVRSTLKFFREEYEAHIKHKKCPGAVCKELITYTIDEKACTGCLVCKKRCPQTAITGKKKEPHKIIQEKCIKCGICEDVCKFDAVFVA